MRIIVLLIVIAIMSVVIARRARIEPIVEQITGTDAAQLSQAPPGSIEASKKSGYGRQMGRAQDTAAKLKARNSDGEF